MGEEDEERFAAGYVRRGGEEVLEGGDGCSADVKGVGGGDGGGGYEGGGVSEEHGSGRGLESE